jgi:lipopolysaccharide export system permease protein
MDARVIVKALPIGSIVDRYLARGFLRVFFVSLFVITSLYLIVDFFDRIGALLGTATSLGNIVRYFIYKTPLLLSRVIGFATLFSALFCLGMLARTRETTAMRASGISVQRIALPLIIISLFICLFSFVWGESIAPLFAHRAQTLYRSEIKNRQQRSLLGTADIWIRGEGSFINVDNFDAAKNSLQGVTIFLLNRDFGLRGILEIPTARWTGERWEAKQAIEWHLTREGGLISRKTVIAPPITDTPEDLKLLARQAEEFSYFDLQRQISEMKSKGLDATSYEVDLQSKLALPWVSLLMVLIAIPFALRREMSGSMALSFGAAMIIGFSYWIVTAFSLSLGHNGALTPWIAAWLPNAIFAMIGLFFFTADK